MFDEFDKFLKISDSYEEPEQREYAPTENLQVLISDMQSLLTASWLSCSHHISSACISQ